jgi:hypothetical protein
MDEGSRGDARRVDGELERVARQRTAPAIYLVDDECNVLLGWSSGSPASPETSHELPHQVHQAVRELQWAMREGAGAPLVRLLYGSFVVRVANVAGKLGSYTAVLVERFRSRGDESGPGRGYALTPDEFAVFKELTDTARIDDIARATGSSRSAVEGRLNAIVNKVSARRNEETLGRIVAHATEAAAQSDRIDG